MANPIKTSIDAHVYESAPSTNYGGSVKLALNGGTGTDDRVAFLHFTPPFELGATIVSAVLRLRTKGAWAGSQNVTASRVTSSWAEARVTWANQPTVTATNEATEAANALADGATIELDVTALMQDVANGAPFYGFRLALSANVLRELHSSESPTASKRPELEVEWSQPPDPPSSLIPSGGRAVSLALPVLAWTFTDPGGGMAQASSQVQIDDAEDFATPLYDSGKFANTDSSWDLAATAFAGLAPGDVRYWRVRVWDQTDMESEWSDAVEFTRVAKGTLTLVSPPDGGTVDDLTPPVDWTFSGTQTAYYLVLQRATADGYWAGVYTSGRVASTDTDLTLPAGLIVTGETYRLTLRVYDDVDRAVTAGDADYVEDVAEFTYARSGGPDPVTALTATPQEESPAVLLEWSRAVQPDYFTLKVDGVEVASRIEPTDVFVSGTSYAMLWWEATPRVESTYEVEAVVDSAGSLENSDGNATDAATTEPIGIWLVDPSDDLAVTIYGREPADLAVGESSATLQVLGSRAPVRIYGDVRGYEGSIGGVLLGADVRDDFLELKGRLTPLRLILSDVNILVELEDSAVPPTPIPGEPLYLVDCAVVQVGDFSFEVRGG